MPTSAPTTCGVCSNRGRRKGEPIVLQIVTKMYFRKGVPLYSTVHRAVLYTNRSFLRDGVVDLPIGELAPSTGHSPVSTVTLSATEHLEAEYPDGERSTHITTGGTDLIDDLADVRSQRDLHPERRSGQATGAYLTRHCETSSGEQPLSQHLRPGPLRPGGGSRRASVVYVGADRPRAAPFRGCNAGNQADRARDAAGTGRPGARLTDRR